MSEVVYQKLQVACEYIEVAMELFLSEKNFFCAIHLAAAAEELFGKHLPEERSSHDRTWKAHRAFEFIEGRGEMTPKKARDFVNRAKNSAKHMDRSAQGTNDSQIVIDAAKEAERLIERALQNQYELRKLGTLSSHKSPTQWKYEDTQAQKARDLVSFREAI